MSAPPTPDSRPYIHVACGSTTTVTGRDFTALCDPLRLVTSTLCANCASHVPLTQVMWADTGEVIAKARDRWALEVPPGVRALNSELGCGVPLALGAALGAGVGWAVGNGETMNVGIGTGVGAVVLALIWLGFVAPLITKKFYGWEPRRLK